VFSEEEIIEKDILMSSGFLEWDRRDFHRFIQALDIYPKEDAESIAKHVGNKTNDQIEAYTKRFFESMDDLAEAEKIKRNLKRSEANLSFKREAPKLIKQKVTAYERPLEEMNISLP
jgi:SWI/SNF-related matrix-associated actin-dependent regulator of chromatin subfamily A member 5